VRVDRVGSSKRTTRSLLILLGVAFLVSVVHYVDNYVNYADYPQPGHGDLPAPSATVVGLSWFVFTASGLAGLRWSLMGRTLLASLALTGYAMSGLVGIAHYSLPGASAMPWWRHGHVVLDIVCGVLVLGFALGPVLRRTAIRQREK
jgi:hypothetical protein